MSWFSNLAEAYDRVFQIDESLLIPLNHWEIKSDVCIAIDGDGKFLRASQDKEAIRIRIPVTESSQHSRTGAININDAHALHEKLEYLSSMNITKKDKYLNILSAWCGVNPKLHAVFNYISGGTILDDLSNEKIKLDKNIFVRFRVEIPNDKYPNLWEDVDIVKAWQNYCINTNIYEKALCQITGKISDLANMHPKGINWSASGAKLVSRNSENYVFKGRFKKEHEANSISLSASHKASAMLNYLIATHGYKCDTQAIVAWAIDDGSAQPDPFADSYGLFGETIKTANDRIDDAQREIDIDYAKKLRGALAGMGNVKSLDNTINRVAVMAMDAATTGRMGITFYQDLEQNEYIERIIAWHESCKWWFFHRDWTNYVSAPSVNSIIAAVYGEPKGEGYKKIQKQARERLLNHIICGQPLDRSWISAAVARVSRPFSYIKKDGGWDKWSWNKALSVTCAITKKYFSQKKEEFNLKLDKNCTNRNYLFGRLLAIAEILEEREIYSRTGEWPKQTNAMRYMTAFSKKPLRTWQIIRENLNPYIIRLKNSEWHKKQIDGIMILFQDGDFNDKPLDGIYLLGYSLQRKFLNKKTKKTKITKITRRKRRI